MSVQLIEIRNAKGNIGVGKELHGLCFGKSYVISFQCFLSVSSVEEEWQRGVLSLEFDFFSNCKFAFL